MCCIPSSYILKFGDRVKRSCKSTPSNWQMTLANYTEIAESHLPGSTCNYSQQTNRNSVASLNGLRKKCTEESIPCFDFKCQARVLLRFWLNPTTKPRTEHPVRNQTTKSTGKSRKTAKAPSIQQRKNRKIPSFESHIPSRARRSARWHDMTVLYGIHGFRQSSSLQAVVQQSPNGNRTPSAFAYT
ncbi:hypothetical protein ONS96_009296 [Cadophora gregata f. sp. sojae]|nr:hypothetical protein ONS96_009296 [Cadophora gregata f. sp. sojae]